jgi:putative ABC transport system permease protein
MFPSFSNHEKMQRAEAQVRSILSQATARENFNMLVLTVFGLAALLLAAVGIYGLMAYSVAQ